LIENPPVPDLQRRSLRLNPPARKLCHVHLRGVATIRQFGFASSEDEGENSAFTFEPFRLVQLDVQLSG
jgi:hypothetical protein